MATNMQMDIRQKSFTQDDGTITPYKRLRFYGYINGKLLEVELKATSAEMAILGMLYEGAEDLQTTTQSGGKVDVK